MIIDNRLCQVVLFWEINEEQSIKITQFRNSFNVSAFKKSSRCQILMTEANHLLITLTKCSFSTFSWLMYSFTLFTSLFDIKSENLVTDWVVLYKLPNRNSQLYCWKCISSLTEKWAKEAIECKLHEFFLHWALQ